MRMWTYAGPTSGQEGQLRLLSMHGLPQEGAAVTAQHGPERTFDLTSLGLCSYNPSPDHAPEHDCGMRAQFHIWLRTGDPNNVVHVAGCFDHTERLEPGDLFQIHTWGSCCGRPDTVWLLGPDIPSGGYCCVVEDSSGSGERSSILQSTTTEGASDGPAELGRAAVEAVPAQRKTA